ncbi:hypothetical protein [Hyphomicrobium sp. LHD-15]|uniref:hypothetical protein n=1 Tax=Hyphomicrobium sp. LHD-15 TaxID=3072142 RepID=UPI00280DCC07|nr:hypothetical protein [Hyphomicrobium sp. LHD-15]MDQ8700224.1 hypothetical protein [Hyphomicrobium sp. LHD-15]
MIGTNKIGRRMRQALERIARMVSERLGISDAAIYAEPTSATPGCEVRRELAIQVACYMALLLTSAKPSVVGAVYGNRKAQTVKKLARIAKEEMRHDAAFSKLVRELVEDHLDERIAARAARRTSRAPEASLADTPETAGCLEGLTL